MKKISNEMFEELLKCISDLFRGRQLPIEIKSTVPKIILLKHILDTFDAAQQNVIKTYLDKGETKADAERLASNENEYDKTFFVPECARWSNLKDLKHDIGSELDKAIKAIEKQNPSLAGVSVSINFNNNNKFGDKTLKDLLSLLSMFQLGYEDFESPKILADTFYIINKILPHSTYFEHSSPLELSKLLISLVKPEEGMKLYDPVAGCGNTLVQAHNYLVEKGENPQKISLYGQEMNRDTFALCKINMIFNRIINSDICLGDTLHEPQHIDDGKLISFDRAIAHPPLGLRWRSNELPEDPYGRFKYGIPLKSEGEFAFIQHMIASLNSNGKMGIVVSAMSLFRQSGKKLREGILEDDIIEAIIDLPSSLTDGTNVRTFILMINKNKSSKRKNKILYIGEEKLYERTKFKNKLREHDLTKIVSTFENWQVVKNYSEIITLEQVRNNDFNLQLTISDIKFKNETSVINTDFNRYKEYTLSEVSTNIERVRPDHTDNDLDNNIFIPNIGFGDVVTKITEKQKNKKLQKYVKVTLNEKIVSSKYLTIFFKSEIGKLTRHRSHSGSVIPSINFSDISKIKVNIPDLNEQMSIFEVHEKVQEIKTKILEIENLLKLTPSDNESHQLLDGILKSVKNFKLGDYLLCDESISHEFKASLRVPYPDYPEPYTTEKNQIEYKIVDGKKPLLFKSKKQINEYFEGIILKAIASLLNTTGGTLVIGVHEKNNVKTVVGIDRELEGNIESHDHYERHLCTIISNRFKDGNIVISQFIRTNIEKINGINVCVVEVSADTGDRIFYLEGQVHIRKGPLIETLTTEEVVELYKEKSGTI